MLLSSNTRLLLNFMTIHSHSFACDVTFLVSKIRANKSSSEPVLKPLKRGYHYSQFFYCVSQNEIIKILMLHRSKK